MEWMPIESAPKDGTSVLVVQQGWIEIRNWYSLGNGLGDNCGWMGEGKMEPTHWLPLPEPPKESA